MASGLSIRPATLHDHPSFAKLFLELAIDDPVPSPERFKGDMLATTLIAEQDGRCVGYAYFRPMKEVVHLAHIVSAPEARRAGVGRALMTEVARRAKLSGCGRMSLNVRSDNTAAIRLYESFGLAQTHRNHGFRIAWTLVEAQRQEATLPARPVTEEEDELLEAQCALPKGVLAEQRARQGRVIRAITNEPGKHAIAVFDVGFPGTYPFRASDVRHAWSLLLAFRPFARPEDDVINVLVEDQADVAAAFVAAGATLKVEAVFMRGGLESAG